MSTLTCDQCDKAVPYDSCAIFEALGPGGETGGGCAVCEDCLRKALDEIEEAEAKRDRQARKERPGEPSFLQGNGSFTSDGIARPTTFEVVEKKKPRDPSGSRGKRSTRKT